MRVIARSTLREFWEMPAYVDSEGPLRAWLQDTEAAVWNTPQSIRDVYRNASIIANNRVVFNIKGNDYRLIVAIHYNRAIVYIRFVGTHADYDKVDAETVWGSKMNIRPIRSDQDYHAALTRIESLMEAAP